jgi:hypothetical protein
MFAKRRTASEESPNRPLQNSLRRLILGGAALSATARKTLLWESDGTRTIQQQPRSGEV